MSGSNVQPGVTSWLLHQPANQELLFISKYTHALKHTHCDHTIYIYIYLYFMTSIDSGTDLLSVVFNSFTGVNLRTVGVSFLTHHFPYYAQN